MDNSEGIESAFNKVQYYSSFSSDFILHQYNIGSSVLLFRKTIRGRNVDEETHGLNPSIGCGRWLTGHRLGMQAARPAQQTQWIHPCSERQVVIDLLV